MRDAARYRELRSEINLKDHTRCKSSLPRISVQELFERGHIIVSKNKQTWRKSTCADCLAKKNSKEQKKKQALRFFGNDEGAVKTKNWCCPEDIVIASQKMWVGSSVHVSNRKATIRLCLQGVRSSKNMKFPALLLLYAGSSPGKKGDAVKNMTGESAGREAERRS